jgi:LmbE family N-acetylglucosaminyl deacetylase
MKAMQLLLRWSAAAVLAVASGYAVPTNGPANPAKILLAVFAHPDDETVCAGVLARAEAGGWEVRVIFATSGDHGSDVSGRNLKGAALGKEREREGACALTALGVKRPPTFLGFGDGTLPQARTQVTERLVKELAGLKADVVLTFGPDGFTRHRDHIAVGAAADEAAKNVSPSSAVYHVALGKQLAGWAKAAGAEVPKGVKLPENLVTVDVQQFQTERLAGLDCHKTQWTREIQARLREFRKAYPFEEFLWAGGDKGAPGKWVGP